jgi:hypothetical protein
VSEAANSRRRATRRVSHSKGPISSKRLTAALATIGTVIGVLAAGTSLFDWFGSKVDPPSPPPPAEIDARVIDVTLRSPRERLVDYLKETNQSTAGLSKFEGAEEGYVFAIRLRIKGNEGKPLPLRWSMIDARTGIRLPGPTYNQTPVVFKPRGPDQARTWPIWVPYPPTKGKYRLRATLIDEKRQPLDEAESELFTLQRAPAP